MARNEQQEDTRARYRSEMGFTRELEVARTHVPNPARGGSRGYSVNQRMQLVDQFDRGEHVQGTSCVPSIYRTTGSSECSHFE